MPTRNGKHKTLLGAVPLALVPWTAHVQLAPRWCCCCSCPALLYWESLNTSLREIRANLRVVIMSSVLLVLATAGTVAVVGHALGLSWPVAWVLGVPRARLDARVGPVPLDAGIVRRGALRHHAVRRVIPAGSRRLHHRARRRHTYN